MTVHVAPDPTAALAEAKAVCIRSFAAMAGGDLRDLEAIVHPDAVNREAKDEPPAARGRGPAAFYATALWLREAFGPLRFEVHEVVGEGDLVVIHCTMYGTHRGTFVAYGPEAEVKDAFPATRREFAVQHTHWFRMADGKVIEHWANRDDLGMAEQAGWVPPTPIYLLRMALAKRRARREHGRP